MELILIDRGLVNKAGHGAPTEQLSGKGDIGLALSSIVVGQGPRDNLRFRAGEIARIFSANLRIVNSLRFPILIGSTRENRQDST